MEISELKKTINDISPKDIADEFLNWLIKNVDNYIDNHKEHFILTISPKEAGNMPVAEKVEELYLSLDDANVEISLQGEENFDWNSLDNETKEAVEIETQKLNMLHEIVQNARDELVSNTEALQKLFKALAYYYEVVGFRNGIPIEKELVGKVNIDAFHYEAVSVPVEVKGKEPVYDDNGDLVEVKETDSVTYMIPPSFVIDFSLDMMEKKVPTSIF